MLFDRYVASDIHGNGGLTHAGTTGDHLQVSWRETDEQIIECRESKTDSTGISRVG